MTTIGGGIKSIHGEEVRLVVSSLNGDESVDIPSYWTVNKLLASRTCIPTAHDVSQWSRLAGMGFPEPENKNVAVIIGCDVPEAHWVLDQRRGRRKAPDAVKTLLGWTLMGPVGTVERQEDTNLHSQLERVFQMEFSEKNTTSKSGMSLED